MKKPEGDGIACDYCRVLLSVDFVYYSLDFYEVSINNWVRSMSADPVYSADFCEHCLELYKDRVKLAYVPPAANTFICDVSGEVIKQSTFKFYQCNISKVIVNLSSAPYKCSDCANQRSQEEGPCPQCTKDTKFVKTADISVDDKYLEINFSEAMFNKFVNHVNFVKTGDSEWS